ncbi:MAG: hypothetical protein ACW99Q_22705 [Candidatus Kariarchaeaceae archaeon]|jgi:L-asparagine transporter-like permease
MNLPSIVIGAFIILEFSNVIALYFKPEFKFANGIGVFTAWEKSKNDPEIHNFARYMVNWVAGTKLIFLLLLVVILFTTDQTTINLTLIALFLSVLTFFWRLFPLIRKMDQESQINPKNYSTYLFLMILIMVIVFLISFYVSSSFPEL